MNILYIGPYREGSGWAEAAKRIILSLRETSHNVVIRPIRYNNHKVVLDDELLELESKSHLNYDIVIQNCLPHNFEYVGGTKNIGMWWSETNSYKVNQWANRINLLDRGIVFNDQMVDAARKSGVNIPLETFIIPHYDPGYYAKVYHFNQPIIDTSKKYVFYNICEANRRKNIAALLIAFHTEFDPHEDVELVIKTDVDISEICNKIKTELKLYCHNSYYKEEILISKRLPEAEICGLHQLADCIVSPSYAEGLCLPVYDALCFGNQAILPDTTWARELITSQAQVRMTPTREEPCFGMMTSFTDLYTGHDTWNSISIMDLRKRMRYAFLEGKKKIFPALKYSFKEAGKDLEEIFDDESN
jgi:glycosyltransferase involved in cell wall biosynthesis